MATDNSFFDKMAELCGRLRTRMDKVYGNEQATKESLIKPLFEALGYDTTDPDAWMPEYNADIPGKKRSEKVDYAVVRGGVPVMFIEAKACSQSETALPSKDGQLARYFNATPSVRISVITNGAVLRFFSDLDLENVQDELPFFTFDIRDANRAALENLEKFTATRFDVDAIREWADDHKNNDRVRRFLVQLLGSPHQAEGFPKYILESTGGKSRSSSAQEALAAKLPTLMASAIEEHVRARLGQGPTQSATPDGKPGELTGSGKPAIESTPDELSAFYGVRGIISGSGRDGGKVVYKDFPNWFNVSYEREGNWFMRLYFNDKDTKAVLFRLPIKVATEISGSTPVEAKGQHTQVIIAGPDDLTALTKLIIESFDGATSGRRSDQVDAGEPTAA